MVSCGEALVDLVPDPAPGGGPMNVAIACARLGAPTAFVGCVYTAEGEMSVGGESVEAADEVGAGDTLAAAILASVWRLGLAEAPDGIGGLELAD